MHIISQWIVWNVDCKGVTRVIISWNPAGTKTSLIFFLFTSVQNPFLFIQPLLPKMSWSVLLLLPLLFFPPPPLVPPTPSSTHAVIQWKISAVNLSTYGFTIVATLWTPSFRCPAVWKADVQKLNSWLDCRLFSFLIYLWKAVCLLSFPFCYSAKPDLMCFFFFFKWATKLHWGAQLLMSQMINEMIQFLLSSEQYFTTSLDCHEWTDEF